MESCSFRGERFNKHQIAIQLALANIETPNFKKKYLDI